MLADCDDKDENDIIKQTDQLRFGNGKKKQHRIIEYINGCPRKNGPLSILTISLSIFIAQT
jgi:hypothetical protein